ncbi:MAG: phospholipid carrier-dependent glycosyltransferase [Clostridia bacterium]|nr:phospholipid carrier-dependent glycosyltransferase [Clostridia bacterium]
MRLTRTCIVLLLLLSLLALPCAAWGEDGQNLLQNPGFEELDSRGLPRGWSTDEWNHSEGYTVYSVSDSVSHSGSRSACVQNFGENDARFIQTVQVEPEELYRLSGWVWAEGVPDFGWGANISVLGVYSSTEGCFETEGQWEYVEIYGETGPDQTQVTVSARLGGYSGESIGKACFDDLCLTKVREVPGTAVAARWFRTSSNVAVADDTEDDAADEGAAEPFWPWLLVLSALYLLAGMLMAAHLRLDRREDLAEKASPSRRMPAFAVLGIILSVLLRLVIALLVTGYDVDINCFLAWGNTMRTAGPTGFYAATSFCDYPPAYVWVMGLNNVVNQACSGLMGSIWSTRLSALVMKLIPTLCDAAMAWLLYRFARERKMNRDQAGLLSLLCAFNPVFVLNTAAWGQIDSVLALLLMLVADLAIHRKWKALMPVYVLSVLVKPQALMLGPLGLIALIAEWIGKGRTDEERRAARRDMLIGLGLSAAVAVLVILPFGIHQPFGWLISLYGNTLSSYAYATVNTANLYYLFGLNWQAITGASTIGVGVVLSLISLCWGLWCWRKLKAIQAPLPWLETVLMTLLATAFVLIPVFGGTWALLGYLAMGLAFTVVLPLYIRSGKLEHLPLLGGLLFLLLYVLGIKMHERYYYPAIILLLMAFAQRRDRKTLFLLLLTSCTVFINEGIVLDNSVRLGASMGHLNNDTAGLARCLSLLNLLCVPLALYTCADICLTPSEGELDLTLMPLMPIQTMTRKALSPAESHDSHRLNWKRIDTLLVTAVTLLYSALTLCNLGSTKAPQTFWTSSAIDEEIVLDLGEYYYNFSMAYYCGVSYKDFTVQVSDDGKNWSEEYWAEMNQGSCYHWKYLGSSTVSASGRSYPSVSRYSQTQRLSGRYVKLRANQINLCLGAVIFRESSVDENGAAVSGEEIPVTFLSQSGGNPESPLYCSGALAVDEPGVLEGEPGWFNSTYFDEIYHARTAYEHYKGTSPYETTHPPLGKVIMSWCVAIFGMTPFGWRFAGALMGILMLPAMYALGKQLTKRTDMAFAAMAMMALDCMHFTQTRIATIDSFPVLFIICSYLFMLRFMQRDISAAPLKTLLPDLAFSGFFMGCAVASKWIGVYAGLGLAVLFFWACARHLNLSLEAERLLRQDAETPGLTPEEKALLETRSRCGLKRIVHLCLWCLLFFVTVPLAIYLLSYVPYYRYANITSLGEFLRKVWESQNYMLNYHSTPRLGMDHPFYSPWYEWPLIERPMYYAMAAFVPAGYSQAIFCFGNPAVWLTGLAGLACTVLVWALRRRYVLSGSDCTVHLYSRSASIAPAFVIIGLLAQFLPWVLVPRGTYIYHYFASIPFLILSITLTFYWISLRWPGAGRLALIVYLILCLGCFILFYPYASGVLTPVDWLDFVKQFLHVYHA